MIWSQLRRRSSRALALAAGILVASTSFTLLTSTVTTSQARTTGLVQRNALTSYDVLVRPPGAVTSVERERGLVQANFQSGIFGGITLAQYRRIKKLAGVEVAAPIANIGYLMVQSQVPVDVTKFLDSKAQSQLLRIKPVLTAGATDYPVADQYLYLTRTPLKTFSKWDERQNTWPGLQQEQVGRETYDVCWYYNNDKFGELQLDGTPVRPQPMEEDLREMSPFDPKLNSGLECASGQGRAAVDVPTAFPVLLAAIDPAAEDRLTGLSGAVTTGRMLDGRDRTVWAPDADSEDTYGYQVPVVLSSRPLTSGTLDVSVERLDAGDPAALPAELGGAGAYDFVNALHGTPVGRVAADLGTGYGRVDSVDGIDTTDYWTVGPVDYRSTKDAARDTARDTGRSGATGGAGSTAGGAKNGLIAVPRVAQRPDLWRTNLNQQPVPYVPEENTGTQFRDVTAHPSTFCSGGKVCAGFDAERGPIPSLRLIGRYDIAKLPGFSEPAQAPLETFQAPKAGGAGPDDLAALHHAPMFPDRNLGGYLSPPPTLLTTLDSISAFTHSRRAPTAQEQAPVSTIRIRVAGVTGVDTASRTRVNAVAGQIRAAYPRLHVEVTVGSSPAPQTVTLPSGLSITENWTSKGAALRILRAVDTKSALLFVLVLVVCALFLGQAALASVRSRRTEIGTLRCLGWSAPEVLRLILGELAVIGLGAGALGALLAYGLGRGLGLPDTGTKALLVLPVALLLALTAGAWPAWRATRMGPLDAVTLPVTATHRAAPVRSVGGLALRNLLRVRGRTVLGAAGLALGVAAFTVLLSLTLAFRGEVAGSLLGNAVIAQARTSDYLSVCLSLLLGAAGAVDVLVLSQRERAADLAVLRASGWTNRELARLTLYEGIGLALFGGVSGAVAGLTAVLTIGQGMLEGRVFAVAGAALLATLAAVVLVCAALAVPIRTMGRIAPAHLLAGE